MSDELQGIWKELRSLRARTAHLEAVGYGGLGAAGDADTVDGFDASAAPTANKLLAMNANAKFPGHTVAGALTAEGILKALNYIASECANARFIADAISGNAEFILGENGTQRYSWLYVPGDNLMGIWSIPQGTWVYQIRDVGLDVLGNSDFIDDAFDWVCGACGWHSAFKPDDEKCPECSGAVEWQDDAALMQQVTRGPIRELPKAVLDRMEKLGLLSFRDGSAFLSWTKGHWFSWSAIAQLWQENRRLKQRIAALETG